jgi:ATP-dependent Lon protease
MSGPDILPLFPLSLVAFPGQVVPLHIFEERYQRMIADCRAGVPPASFGICLSSGSQVHGAGCSAAIEQVVQEYDDGRLDLLVRGQQRFRLLEIFRDRPYLTGAVEFFDDLDEPADPALLAAASEAYGRLLAQLSGPGPTWAFDAGELPDAAPSFFLAPRMGLGLEEKQELLEMRRESERLRALIEHAERLRTALRQRQERIERSRGNGRHRW